MRLYCTQAKEFVELMAKPEINLYVCGITPYDSMHVGHVAMFLTYDVLARRMQDLGSTVNIVRNITDIDDPLLPRALEMKIPYWDLVESEVTQYHKDVRALELLPARIEARASDYVDSMATATEELLRKGRAYRLEDSIYYSVADDTEFGSLSGFDRVTMIEHSREHGGDPDRVGKKDPLDFLLWQPSREGEPEYESRVGVGRPGWHIGCSIMSREHLGSIDVHGGGEDLIFPHHECENTQNRSLSGGSRVAMWVHSAFVWYEGHKMSKSRGNVVLTRNVLKEYDPRVLRLAILTNYRHNKGMEWRDDFLPNAATVLDRWARATEIGAGPEVAPFEKDCMARLDDNLDFPGAVAVIDRYARSVLENTGSGEHPEALTRLAGLLGIDLRRRYRAPERP